MRTLSQLAAPGSCSFVLLWLLLGSTLNAAAQGNATAQGLVQWMNNTWRQNVDQSMASVQQSVAASKVALSRRAPSNQVESNSATANSTSLLDRSSATDFLGLALNLADLSGKAPDGIKTNSGSVTTSAYAFRTLLTEADPLDPRHYCRLAPWRQATLSLGFEGEDDNPMANNSAVTVGTKYVFWNGRDPCSSRYDADFDRLTKALVGATIDFGSMEEEERKFLFKGLKGKDYNADQAAFITFSNDMAKAPDFELWLKAQPGGTEALEALRKRVILHGEKSKALQGLQEMTQALFQKIRGAPQSSAQFVTRQQSKGADSYDLKLLFDCGSGCQLSERFNFTANGGFKYFDNPVGSNDWSGSAALSLQIRLNPEPNLLQGRNFYLAVSGRGDWTQGRRALYQAQAKISLPVLDGFEIPISFHYANRTERHDEREFRIQAGFAVDTSRLFSTGTNLGVVGRLVGAQ